MLFETVVSDDVVAHDVVLLGCRDEILCLPDFLVEDVGEFNVLLLVDCEEPVLVGGFRGPFTQFPHWVSSVIIVYFRVEAIENCYLSQILKLRAY